MQSIDRKRAFVGIVEGIYNTKQEELFIEEEKQ